MIPKVSVITAVRNNATGLRRCLDSVFRQDYPAVESIVIDGESDDGTLKVLDAASERIAYWVSEPDHGIADAMNKGVSASSGDLILFLHSDDYFVDPGALSRCVRHIDDFFAIWVYDVFVETGTIRRRASARPFNWWARFRNPMCHQGVLCPRPVIDLLGMFDERLKIEMDYDLWFRAMNAGVRQVIVPEVLAVMGGGGVSSRRDWQGLSTRFEEERLVQYRYAVNWLWRTAYTAFWPPYRTYRWVKLLASAHDKVRNPE